MPTHLQLVETFVVVLIVRAIGFERAHKYRRELLGRVLDLLEGRWGGQAAGLCPRAMHGGYLGVVRLPIKGLCRPCFLYFSCFVSACLYILVR